MIRLSLTRAALAGGLLWAAAATAQDTPPARPGITPQTQKINELIAKGWADAGIKRPAARSTDHEFMRRVFIDLIGRIPMPEEITDFEMDRSADKRAKLVNRLLYEKDYKPKGKNGGPVSVVNSKGEKVTLTFDYGYEYSEHWANLWTNWLMTRSSHQLYRDQMAIWLTTQFAKSVSHKDVVSQIVTATGKGNENGAVNFVAFHLGEKLPPGETGKYGEFDAIPVASRVTRLFLGIQTQCTQCHDHPMNKQWLQSDFWGVNAFFRQTVRSATPTPKPANNNQKMNLPVQLTVTDKPDLNGEGIILYERRDGKRMASFPTMLKDLKEAEDGKMSAKRLAGSGGTKNRRQQLAEWVTGHDNFGRAYVNRSWGHFFGRGLMKEPAYDDFGNTEVVHGELLNFLGEEFVKYGYDYRKLHEWICTSDAYQLSHVANKEYSDPVKYDAFFAWMPLKALSPEVLFESLMVATRAELRADADAKKTLREQFMGKLVQNFGDDEGNEVTFNGTVIQALLMMNGKEINDVIGVGRGASSANNVIMDVAKKRGYSPSAIYDELFLMALGRHPTSAEVAKLEQVRTSGAVVNLGPPVPKKGPRPKGGGGVAAAPGVGPGGEVAFYQDVFWALLNTNEFMLNH